jgi:4-carboxymuconolactone decarboxylase
MSTESHRVRQGFGVDASERLAIPDRALMTATQRAAADARRDGPRKSVYGPYIPLLHTPELLALVDPLGAQLRFEGTLDPRVRELVVCAVARHTGNQFEWVAQVPQALSAGIALDTIDALRDGRHPADLPADEAVALDFAQQVMTAHGVADDTYQRAKSTFGEAGLVELTTLVGYFVMVCWLMNVARTTVTENPDVAPLTAFPA